MEQRWLEKSARAAYMAEWWRMRARMKDQIGLPPAGKPCETCGLPTSKWCDECEEEGRWYMWMGMRMEGTPYCSGCERESMREGEQGMQAKLP